MSKATKIRDREWSYRGGLIEHLGRRTGMRSASWRWAWCGAAGYAGTKADAASEIDRILRHAQAVLESEDTLCVGPSVCRHGIDN
jgi:hypothetical protein